MMQPSGVASPVRRGRRPGAFVVHDPAPEEVGAPVDWSAWYLTDEDDMGESVEQGEIIRILLSCLSELLAERGITTLYCGGDHFFAWVRGEPLVRVSPDVYLLEDPPPPPRPKMWQTWLPGHRPPRWAVEIVSDEWKKDYEENPPKYAQLGVRELVIFDPEAALSPDRRGVRVPLQVYRRDADGAFVRVYRGDGPARSEEVDAFLVVGRERGAVRLRIARDAAGADLVPTTEEAKRAAEEAKRAAEEAKRAAEEAKRAADARAAAADQRALAAEERLRALEAELAKRRGG
ncbi:Uma2 family endonuclease [Sorangium sp. So ce1036]|uniref:Uma2 family endonuclease n=1 Tax=Sorangium sp. So ce1036 TaxID=3133328 RepID=UPI003F041A4C